MLAIESVHRSSTRTIPAPSELPPDAPGLSSAHIGPRRSVCPHTRRLIPLGNAHFYNPWKSASQQFAEGGSLARNQFSRDRPRGEGDRRPGGGLRGEVMEFSRASRRRMLDLLNSINREQVPSPLFITLTYPDEFEGSGEVWKAHLKAFDKRLVRRWGDAAVIWRLELMDRKTGKNAGKIAPHFHLLVFLEVEPSEMYSWLSRAWYEVVGSGDDRHLLAGTRVERMHSWRGVLSYASKYMAKPEQLVGGVDSPGRFWGVRRRNLLPVEIVKVNIRPEDAVRIRRHMARYAGISLKHYANSRSFKAYVPSSVMIRLLRYYGYYRP